MSEEEKETYRREFVDKTINLLNIFNHGNAATSIRNEGVSEVGETATSISGGMPSLARYWYQSGRLAGLVIDVRNNYSDYIEHDKGEENSDERSYRSRYTRQREAAEEGENGVHLQEEYIIPDTESRLQSVKDVLTEPSEPEAETPEAVLNGIRQVSSKNETEDTRRALAEAIEKQVQRDNWKISDTQRDLVKDIQGAAKQAIERWNEMVSEQHLDEVLDTLLQEASEVETASGDDVRLLVDELDSLLPKNKSVREKLEAELPKVFVPGMSKSELLEAAIRKVEEVIPIKNKESKRNRSAISKRFSQMLGVDDAVRSTFGDEFADALSGVEHTMKIKEGTSDDWTAAEKNNPLE